MSKIGKSNKIYCYLMWFIFIAFSVSMFVMSKASNWAEWINVYLVGMAVFMTAVTFNKNVNRDTHSYIFMVCSLLNIFIYGYAQETPNNIILAMCGLAIVCSIYMNVKMMVLMLCINVLILISHIFVFRTVDFSSVADYIQCIITVSIVILSEIGIILFIKYLKVVEKNLKISLEMSKRAEHSKSDFLANMSHEIRTPMNAIVGMCEIILRDDISDEVRENCFNIQNSGRSLLAIINDILDFSKIESGKAELIFGEFNIGSTINDVINMAETRKGDKNVEIIVRVDPNIPKSLIGDEVRIKQVIINLVTNAVKFTNSGCIVLKITQNPHEYGINLNVSVADTGIGISEENIEKLFTSFQQVDTRKNRSVEGTGLGLAITKRLILKMGGFVNVSSVYGEGSEFKFVIPLKVADYTPFISLKNKDEINAAVYISLDKLGHQRTASEYSVLIKEMINNFQIKCSVYSDRKTLEEDLKKYRFSHCIIGKTEYLQDLEYFNSVALNTDIDMAVIQDRLTAVKLPKNIKCIYKPFYALSIASVFNNERTVFNSADNHNAESGFIAPEAKVLIVDDNVINLKVASGLMKPYNMKISTAISGYEAIEKIRNEKYDIVFMDHMMPGMDGVEATRIIRDTAGEYYKNLTVIALTANAINGVREMFMENGFNDFIPKPIELSVLNRVLRKWLPKELVISSMDVEKDESHEKAEVKPIGKHINSATGLMYAGDNKDIYMDNLVVFAENGDEYINSLKLRFETQDWERYVIEVHAIKSTSMSIGAEALSEKAKLLEFAGKEDNVGYIKENHEELCKMYKDVIEEIEQYLEQNGYNPKKADEVISDLNLTEITVEAAKEYADRICEACDDFDSDAIVEIVNEASVYSVNGKSLGEYFAEVKKAAENFDYDLAADNVGKVISEIRNS